jgi:hypothetical protein
MAERKHRDESKTIQRPKQNPALVKRAQDERKRAAGEKKK